MTYNKPTIQPLGEAVRVIQGCKFNTVFIEGYPPLSGTFIPIPPPAYALDELQNCGLPHRFRNLSTSRVLTESVRRFLDCALSSVTLFELPCGSAHLIPTQTIF